VKKLLGFGRLGHVHACRCTTLYKGSWKEAANCKSNGDDETVDLFWRLLGFVAEADAHASNIQIYRGKLVLKICRRQGFIRFQVGSAYC
jgi:hypothetical protein